VIGVRQSARASSSLSESCGGSQLPL